MISGSFSSKIFSSAAERSKTCPVPMSVIIVGAANRMVFD
jgi:hypothetical protein